MPFSLRSLRDAWRRATSGIRSKVNVPVMSGLAAIGRVAEPFISEIAPVVRPVIRGAVRGGRFGYLGAGIGGILAPAETAPDVESQMGPPSAQEFTRAPEPTFITQEAFVRPYISPVTPTLRSTPTPTRPTRPTRPTALAPTPTAKPLETTPRPAPTPTPTPPTPRGFTGGAPITGGIPTAPVTGLAGFGAPAPTGMPPTPTLPAETPPAPPMPENIARFETLIRALQQLGAGAFVPTPMAGGGEPFGPAGALERALRRIRERELRI